MSHEIYYTSAPEGMKRGTSGFCTVAASENIPKALWDRLETLSAYRHQYAQGAGQTNPVSYAHWILSIAGKSHHVLSRICDSGVDHTQRTNAFAHHLVLEPAELAAAQGGPAWLLEQPGVMMDRWDGQVGALTPARMARGDIFSSSRVCKAWAAVTGDAGWGGHLADLFVKSPTRPVCILLGPGQDALPLIAESLALLPSATRWNVTFNTYFTSMPTSATCVWRCCLAGTQAAQTGLRYAASGLVLDLTDRARLPALPPGAYVTMARTGQAAEAPRAGAASAAKAAQPTLAELKSRAGIPPAAKAPRPIYDPEGDEEERAAEQRRDSIFDFAAPAEPAAAPEESYELRDDPPVNVPPVRDRPRARAYPPQRTIRRAEDALEDAEREAAQAAQRRRKQVMLLFMGALGAIAVGCGLVYFANRSGAPPELPPGTSATFHPRPADSNPVTIVPDTVPQTVGIATQEVPATIVQQTRPINATLPDVVVPTITYPENLVLATLLEKPNIGTGIGDRTQSLGFKAADLDPLPVTGLRLAFFASQAEKLAAPPVNAAGPATYKNNVLGALTAVPGASGNKKGFSMYWRPASDPGLGTELAFVALDRAKPGLEWQWHAAALLRNPGVFNYVFWVFQNSALVLESPRATKQQIVMKPFTPPTLNFTDAAMAFTWPADLPRDVRAVEPSMEFLPAGWKADWYLDWDAAIAVGARTTDNANQIISFKKPTSVPKIEAWFLLSFKPGANGGIAKAECTYGKRVVQDQDDLARAERELADVTKKITDLRNDPAMAAFGGGVPPELTAKQADLQLTVDAYKAAVAGYNDLTKFDVSFDLSDKMRLATLHFQRPETPETGK